MTRNKQRTLYASLAGLIAAMAQPLAAQVQGSASEATDNPDRVIIVTAQKRAQDLIEVPQSLS